jgi:hypothetical protein
MLRHFKEIPASLKEQLFAKGYSQAEIEESLHAPGSRFGSQFVNSIDQLLDRLFTDCTYSVREGLNGNLLVHAVLSIDKFQTGVGTCGVVSIDSLEESQRSKVYRKKNRDVMLWHLDVKELPKTGEFTLILKPTNDHFIFITAFPGPPAMPLPDHRMSNELYDACGTYWDKHVFLYKRDEV